MKNKFYVEGDFVWIALTQGQNTIIDLKNLEKVSEYQQWSTLKGRKTFYAVTSIRREDGTWGVLLMHTLITGFAETDHWDRDGLNNRESNLRDGSGGVNQRNHGMYKHNTSGYKGVWWSEGHQKWGVQICRKHIGYFDDPKHAAFAYNCAAENSFPEGCYLNEIKDLSFPFSPNITVYPAGFLFD